MTTYSGRAQGEATSSGSSMKIDTRRSFVRTHLTTAIIATQKCEELEHQYQNESIGAFFREIESNAITAIFFSVASLEANINEYFFEASEGKPYFQHLSTNQSNTLWELVDRKPLLKKYTKAGSFACDTQDISVITNGEFYQSIHTLLTLRNSLVHFRPEWVSEQNKHAELSKKLEGKFPLSPFISKSAPIFPQRCMSHGMAKWVVTSTISFMVEFSETTGLPNRVKDLQKMIDTST